MRLYETGFLVAPGMTEDEAEAVVQQMAEVVAQKKGRMIRIERWGKRRMAYAIKKAQDCLLYTSPSPRDRTRSRMPSSA